MVMYLYVWDIYIASFCCSNSVVFCAIILLYRDLIMTDDKIKSNNHHTVGQLIDWL